MAVQGGKGEFTERGWRGGGKIEGVMKRGCRGGGLRREVGEGVERGSYGVVGEGVERSRELWRGWGGGGKRELWRQGWKERVMRGGRKRELWRELEVVKRGSYEEVGEGVERGSYGDRGGRREL